MQTVHPSALHSALSRYPIVLVEFMTRSCGPCRNMPPLLRAFEEQTGVPVLQVDLEYAMSYASHYNILQVPTSVLYRGRREAGRVENVPAGVHALVGLVR